MIGILWEKTWCPILGLEGKHEKPQNNSIEKEARRKKKDLGGGKANGNVIEQRAQTMADIRVLNTQ